MFLRVNPYGNLATRPKSPSKMALPPPQQPSCPPMPSVFCGVPDVCTTSTPHVCCAAPPAPYATPGSLLRSHVKTSHVHPAAPAPLPPSATRPSPAPAPPPAPPPAQPVHPQTPRLPTAQCINICVASSHASIDPQILPLPVLHFRNLRFSFDPQEYPSGYPLETGAPSDHFGPMYGPNHGHLFPPGTDMRNSQLPPMRLPLDRPVVMLPQSNNNGHHPVPKASLFPALFHSCS
jgi:hypothetical protein